LNFHGVGVSALHRGAAGPPSAHSRSGSDANEHWIYQKIAYKWNVNFLSRNGERMRTQS
jgi:hypothetical protein